MKELLFSITKKDFIIDWFSGSGAGGQHRNKCKNCCRIRHKDFGVIITAQESRSQKENLKKAFKRLVNNKIFKIWLNKKIYELSDKGKKNERIIKKRLDEAMQEKNLKIELIQKIEGE